MSVTVLSTYSITQFLRKRSASISSADADVNLFITNAGITDPTQIVAINTLVSDLKFNGFWTKLKAIYPFVGGTATSHKFNLKNPLDTNAAFRLSFLGGVTHSSSGAAFNGTTGYADTFFNSTNYNGLNDKMFCAYIVTNVSGGLDYGATDASFRGESLATRINGICGAHVSNQEPQTAASTDSRGFWLASRTASNFAFFRKNKTNIYDLGNSSADHTGTQVISARRDNGNVASYGGRTFAFVAMGNGITKNESDTLYDIIQAYQTTLGRNV